MEADYKPPTMAGRWATVEQQFEEAHAARRQARALEEAALASWDRYLEDFHCGREIRGVWASRVQYLQVERALIAGAKRVKEERREAERATKRAEEESRAAAQEAMLAQRRAEEARQRQRERERDRERDVEKENHRRYAERGIAQRVVDKVSLARRASVRRPPRGHGSPGSQRR